MFPHRKQETDWWCGPAVVEMLLARSGITASQTKLATELKTNSTTGTQAEDIICVLKARGLSAVRYNNATLGDIEHALTEGREAVVGYLEPEDSVPHYAAVRSLDAKQIVLADPAHGPELCLTHQEFEERWHDDTQGAYGERLLIVV